MMGAMECTFTFSHLAEQNVQSVWQSREWPERLKHHHAGCEWKGTTVAGGPPLMHSDWSSPWTLHPKSVLNKGLKHTMKDGLGWGHQWCSSISTIAVWHNLARTSHFWDKSNALSPSVIFLVAYLTYTYYGGAWMIYEPFFYISA